MSKKPGGCNEPMLTDAWSIEPGDEETDQSRSYTSNSWRRRLAGRWVRVLSVVAATAAAMLLTVTAANADQPARVGGTAVTQRDCYHPLPKQPYPSQNCSPITTLNPGTPVSLVCQYQGQNIYGDTWWDYVRNPNNVYGYVSDYYVNTGTSSYRVPGVPICNY